MQDTNKHNVFLNANNLQYIEKYFTFTTLFRMIVQVKLIFSLIIHKILICKFVCLFCIRKIY